ncbi:aldo/keto reductase family oxidoreductase [Thalassospira sp. TSL5-1]|uniref:aldo/keto reductase n=1 Tax=Thalassospira sp. TSL5-1 TaxID=1544451 RepID=UPI00093FC5CB|nr:aldo/keto reductase [Thalassospira sp. TSL5-1]OKH86214.1 oxidoreductase [Thalassospira sp. TSL5-1]OKH89851.1 oxidoreductase [Thalassospira sp. TSL5-1]
MSLSRRKLANDLSFSTLAWGAWRLRNSPDINSDNDILRLVETALDLGITTIDHADIYGNYGCEELFGNALAKASHLRQKMEIVTKCDIALACEGKPENRINHYNTSKKHILASVESSLRNLRTDHIDALLLHRPDPLMIADEVADAFNQLKRDGKVRYFGVSNFTPSQFNLLQSRLEAPMITNQVECSVLELAPVFDGTFDLMQQNRISPMIWSPLGGARLFRDKDDAVAAHLRPVLEDMRVKYDAPGIGEIAIAWLLALPCQPIPVLGTMKPERLKDATTACSIRLDRQDWFTILVAAQGHPVP